MPLAPLGRLPAGVRMPAGLAGVVERLVERVMREVAPDEGAELLTAAAVLTGLRMTKTQVAGLFRGVQAMRESSGYQWIMDEGREDEARKILLRQGRVKFGNPGPEVEAAVQAVRDLDRLERMSEQLLRVNTWKELLATE